jgi:hypothetical protein
MPNHAICSHAVEVEGETNTAGMYEEDLASSQKECVEERSVIMNLGQDEVQIGQSEKETLSKELEKSACEVNVTEQDNAEVPSTNPITMPSSL